MLQTVTNSAMLKCSLGTLPAPLTIMPTNRVTSGGQPVATLVDHKPLVNIASFGMCVTLTNPQVAAATTAASGVLTPIPCVPNTTTPWTPGSATVQAGQIGVLNTTCQLICLWGGVIQVTAPAQVTTTNS